MSGSDLRNFVTRSTTSSATSHTSVRVKNGLRSNTYKPVDYDGLRELANQKRLAGQASLFKVKEIHQVSKHRKDQNLVKQHKFIWQKEFARLATIRRRVQMELSSAAEDGMSDDTTSQLFADLDNHATILAAELETFKNETTGPVWNLRDDLKTWLSARNSETVDLSDADSKQRLVEVRNQQNEILRELQQEQATLEGELNIDGLIEHLVAPEKHVQTGIPEEAFDLECPDLERKVDALQEFILLDGRYVEKLSELERDHSTVLKNVRGGWSKSDHSLFIYTVDQYQYHEVQNRRLLFVDILRRHLPHKTRPEIVEHENWCMRCKFYEHRKQDLLTDWTRDRTELFNRISVTFREAVQLQVQQSTVSESRQKQLDICNELYSKVQRWREKKMEAMELEEAMVANQRRDREEALAEEERIDQLKREDEKVKIRKFRGEVELKQRQKMERDRRRLEELKKDLEEQAVYDRLRVNYRDEELNRRKEERRKREEEHGAEEEERQRVLEKIREKVRPHVEGDLLRLWSDTVAWQRRQRPEEHVNINRPLFDIKSYTVNQITDDPRFRLEQRLRNAGLHDTEYARQAMTQIKPLHAPRKDMESSVFKYI